MNATIAIVGMPRSGTTWIGKLFDSHPDTLYRHEPDSVQRLHMPLYPTLADAAKYQAELRGFVEALPRMRSAKVVGKQPLFSKHYQSRAGLLAYRASVMAAKVAGRIVGDLPCPYRPTGKGRPDVRVVWKSIESPGRIGVITAALPGTRAIHVMRRPCGYVASMLRGDRGHEFGQRTASADDHWLLERLLAADNGRHRGVTFDLLKRLAPEKRLAWRWVLTQEKILADVGACERVLTVRYEDVCADPLTATRRMFAFAGLDWHPQTEAFIRRGEQGRDRGYYSVVKPTKVPAERWRTELTDESIRCVHDVLEQSPLRRWYGAADDPVRAAVPGLPT
ncbi:MAG TPA: sulfotransferase [Rhodanobacteraceae bacterium]